MIKKTLWSMAILVCLAAVVASRSVQEVHPTIATAMWVLGMIGGCVIIAKTFPR